MLDTITNNGTLTATGSAIQVISGGHVGTIINNGYLQSPSGIAIAVFSGGSMGGTIINTGTIYGGVINRSSVSQMVIVGVTDGSNNYGTFTSGGRTIESTLTGVRFAGGNTLVDMNMNVGLGQTVTNDGASLKFINNRSVVGNFSQTSGNLIFNALSATSFPKLTVTGTASLTGGNIILLPVAGGASAGTYTIISAAGGVASTANATATGYTVLSTISGNNLLLTLTPASVVVPPVTPVTPVTPPTPTTTQTPGTPQTPSTSETPSTPQAPSTPVVAPGSETPVTPQAPSTPAAPAAPSKPTWTVRATDAGGRAVPIGPVLDALAADSNFAALLDTLNSLNGQPQQAALKQLGTPAVTSQAMAGGASYALSTSAIGQRQMALLAGQFRGRAAGSAADGAGAWGQILGNRASLDSSANVGGFHSSTYGLTVGADKQIADDFVAGGAFSWLRNDLNGKDSNNGNDAKVDSYQLAAYGAWRPRSDQLFFNGMLSAGRNNIRQARAIDFLGTAATAEYNGWQSQVKVGIGYDIPTKSGLTVTPLATLQAARIENDGYRESGAGPLALGVDKQGFNNVESELAIKLTAYTDTRMGRLIGDWQTGWLHSFTNNAIATTASLGGMSFVTSADRLDKDGAHIVLRGTLQQTNNLSFSLEYDGVVRSNFRSQTAMAKVRYDF